MESKDEDRKGAVPEAGDRLAGDAQSLEEESQALADVETAASSDGPVAASKVEALVELLERAAVAAGPIAGLDGTLHERLRVAAGRLASPDRIERRRFAKARRRERKQQARERDEAALEGTSNRARKRALGFSMPAPELELEPEARRLLEEHARERPAATGATRLERARDCYVCKAPFEELHPHYDSMCPPCAALNFRKRSQSADLAGRVAIVTGARVKIGFETTLMLLRAGARVIATTRFVVDAAERFAGQPDYAKWRERLRVVPLDLRNTPSVEAFCAARLAEESRLDFLIHNACQTVRRPPAYYAEMVEGEDPSRLSASARELVEGGRDSRLADSGAGDADRRRGPALEITDRDISPMPAGPTREAAKDVASLSVLDLLGEADLAPLFPVGVRDGEGQPLDLRDKNSWRLDLHEVSTIELIEVQLVNAIAPFVMNARLKPLMLAVPTPDKHIVHVSAMEGQFYRTFKTTRHPHTNMAKASLNMMTRTSAADFARDGIHMNSVDTGWVTDEDPFAATVEKERSQRFAPPLDAVDGAARVLDPIFDGFLTGRHVWGQFLKDYAPTRW